MAGSRIIRKGFLDSDRVSKLGWFAECVYHRLLLVADDYGLFDARPTYLRAILFSTALEKVREADVSRALLDCESAGLIRFYEADDKRYLQILRYGQRTGKTKPKWPPPPDFELFRESPGNSGKLREIPAIDGDEYEDGDEDEKFNAQRALTLCHGEHAPAPARRIPLPETEEAVQQYMAALPVCNLAPPEIAAAASAFFCELSAVGWRSSRGQPITNWHAMARSWLAKWQNNLFRAKLQPHRKHDCNTPSKYKPSGC